MPREPVLNFSQQRETRKNQRLGGGRAEKKYGKNRNAIATCRLTFPHWSPGECDEPQARRSQMRHLKIIATRNTPTTSIAVVAENTSVASVWESFSRRRKKSHQKVLLI